MKHRNNLLNKFQKVNKTNVDLLGYNFYKFLDYNFIQVPTNNNGLK